MARFPPGKSGGLIEAGPMVDDLEADCMSFRRVNPAASLKQDLAGAVAADAVGFRRVNPAASLKQVDPGGCSLESGMFPPGKSGGLIEAHDGLIGTGRNRFRFPPGKSGGLIEADECGILGLAQTDGFRRVNPAASLKRWHGPTAQGGSGVSAG